MSQFLTGRRRQVAFYYSGSEGGARHCPRNPEDEPVEFWEVAVSIPLPDRVPTLSILLLEAHKPTRLSSMRKGIDSLVFY